MSVHLPRAIFLSSIFSRANQTYCAINNLYHSSEFPFTTAQTNMLINYELN